MAGFQMDWSALLPDRYRLARELGRGGMATVWLASDRNRHRPVALKILRPQLAVALGTERFLREIELSSRLIHPRILPLLDSGLIAVPGSETLSLPWFTLPYIEGPSLRTRLSLEGRLPLADALQIACEVADALSYAHRQDVLHRDIKPANILLDGAHAVVSDFGIAKALTAASSPDDSSGGMAVGTPAYMSPEQAVGGHALDRRSDIYALGCVLYEMLAGEPPFTGTTAESVARRHISAPVPDIRVVRPDVTEAVATALKRAMSKAPRNRFRSAAHFGRALARVTIPVEIGQHS
jgi:serine/threonine protein kinase